jgi:O-antigen/teichoic acid export membrane protein
MSFARETIKSGLWYSVLKTITQVLSWVVTIWIARILLPDDYGLMAMASMLTGYLDIFGELGLSAAIIQRKQINRAELSSVFWFCMFLGFSFAVVSFFLSYPTAWLFNEPRIIPITQMISVIFLASGCTIVPSSLICREAKFKELGFIQLISLTVASLSMLYMAMKGFGVWTLLFGTIIQRFITACLILRQAKWKPAFHFSFADIRSLLNFGLNITGARTLFYVFQKADKFIVGKVFKAEHLGFYSFAMQLAAMPTEKIVSIAQQILYPVFSKHQDDLETCNRMYLKAVKYIALMVTPLFLGGFFYGEELIMVFLGEKWLPITDLFRALCLTYFVISITEMNGVMHNAQGRPHWNVVYMLACATVMPISIYFVAIKNFDYLLIPWVTVYPALCFGWTWVTLKRLGIPVLDYMKTFVPPFLVCSLILVSIKGGGILLNMSLASGINLKINLAIQLIIVALLYSAYIFSFEKKTLSELWGLRGGR